MQIWLAALLLFLLTGCTSLRLVDAEVQASARPGAEAITGATYRFERLPSQTDRAKNERLEKMADAALSRVGLLRDDSQARISVLLTVRNEIFWVDHNRPPIRGWDWPGIWAGSRFGMERRFPPSPLYHRELSLWLRDLKTGVLVYETRVVNDSPWPDTEPVLAAMFEAGLKDFPRPPAGRRQIHIEIPR